MKLFKDGRTAVVTGVAQGIGFAIAKKFIEEGITKIAVLDINEEKIISAADELAKFGKAEILPIACNIADRENVFAAFETIIDVFGKIDILVNNAGITKDLMFHKMSFEDWDRVVKVNLYGTYNCCSAVVKHMRDNCYGRIVNMSSVVAYGNAGQANYAATKAGIIGLTKTLAKEGARKGITVNAIAPDRIDTPMMSGVPEDFYQMLIDTAPMHRMGQPEEVASLVAFLAGEEASYITGTCVDCGGGNRT